MSFYVNKYYDEGNSSSLGFKNLKLKGYFSLDASRSVHLDSSKMRYYSPTHVGRKCLFDLDEDIESAIIDPSVSFCDEHLSYLLEYIRKNDHKIDVAPKDDHPNFVLRRGTITTILKTPFVPNDAWILCAAKWKGSIYLTTFETEARKLATANCTPLERRCELWGYKFEQYILSDAPNEPPNTTEPVNRYDQFYGMFESRLGDHWLLYAAEMDGVCSEKKLEDPLPLDDLEFIELKTSRKIEQDYHLKSFRKHKTLRWWCQSISVGVEKILCGFRDDNGIVKNLMTFRLADLATIGNLEGLWTPSGSMNFCNDFLTYVANTVVEDCNETIYKFERMPYGHIQMTEVASSSKYSFMPKWYTQSPD